ncbi:MAG: S16 family serine protease, partial [Candidatus Heimdallarchaeaceae archaeon]
RGIIGNVTVEIQPGKGRVLVDTTPLQGIYTQDSERVAVKVTSDITGFDFSDYDVIYSIMTSNAHVIDGPSAGGALTLATIAAVEGKEVSHNFAMTGTIGEDGSIGEVGEILTKAKAAADHGISVFLIPEGQAIQNQYVKKIKRPQPGWYIETIEPVSVNVIEYAEKNWNMKVYEVTDINEVIRYAFGEIPKRDKEIEPVDDNITLPSFTSPVNDYNDFSWMVSNELKRAKHNYRRVSDKLDTSQLPEDVKSVLVELMKKSEDYLENTEEVEGHGYSYSSANEAFKSIITSNVVDDLIEYYSSPNKRRYLENKIKEIQEEINKTEQEVQVKTDKMICDPDNFEWAVAARHRITYAENRVKSIELDEIEEVNPVDVFYKINTAKEWIEISKNFMKKTTLRSAGTDCLEKFKEQAENTIKEAENRILLEKSMGFEDVEDGEWYLEAARAEFEQGWYITSIYDATSAKTRVKVGSIYENKEMDEIYSDFSEMEVIPQDLIGTIFLENSYYNIYRAVKENFKEQAILAIQTLTLSKETNYIYQDIKNQIGKPSFSWSIDWKFEIKPYDYVTILMLIVVVLVLYVMTLTARIKRLERKVRIRMRRKSR